jgi:hypothetical protein
MVKTALVDKYINDGRTLIGALERENFISVDHQMSQRPLSGSRKDGQQRDRQKTV